jgi:hypothetical protein
MSLKIFFVNETDDSRAILFFECSRKIMKLIKFTFFLLLIFTSTIFFVGSVGANGYILHIMHGEVASVDINHQTIVVEVPMGKGLFTVGGKVTSKTRLIKGIIKVPLSSFKIGEKVVIRWRGTPDGHLIESVTAVEMTEN